MSSASMNLSINQSMYSIPLANFQFDQRLTPPQNKNRTRPLGTTSKCSISDGFERFKFRLKLCTILH